MDHLKEISAFVPETPETPLTVSVQEKPAGTVYVPVRTGTAYTGESWERGSDPKAVLSEDMPGFLEDCLMLPGGLDRLEELCKYWDTSSDEAVGRQIDETFEAMAVYDTAPGSVPEESAFEQAEDGTWAAQVEGSMGHAWCQVYEGADRGWVNKEHTPAAPGNGGAGGRGRPVGMDLHTDDNEDNIQTGKDDTGENTRGEQLADRAFRNNGVNDHGRGGRDQDTQCSAHRQRAC